MRPYTSLNSDFKRISPCFMPTNIRFPDDLDLLYATMKKTGELKRLDDDTCSTDRWRRQKLREEMAEAEFDNHRQALIDAKLESDKKLRQESSRYWAEIPLGTLDFERAQTDAEVLRRCTKAQLAAFWAEHLQAGAAQRRKLSSQVFAAQHALPPPPAGVRCLEGREAVLAFKREMCAFPPPSAPPEA